MTRFQVVGPDSVDQVDVHDDDSGDAEAALLALSAEDRQELVSKLLPTLPAPLADILSTAWSEVEFTRSQDGASTSPPSLEDYYADIARRFAVMAHGPDVDFVIPKPERTLDLAPLLELDNWHQLMELVTQVANEPADNAIAGELPGMVDYLLDHGWTVDLIRKWLLHKAAGALPWAVVDGKVEAGEQTPILGRFATEELGAKFIETLPDYETGRYGLDGPGE